MCCVGIFGESWREKAAREDAEERAAYAAQSKRIEDSMNESRAKFEEILEKLEKDIADRAAGRE